MHHGMCNWGLIQEKLASDAERFQKKYDVAALVPVEVFFFLKCIYLYYKLWLRTFRQSPI